MVAETPVTRVVARGDSAVRLLRTWLLEVVRGSAAGAKTRIERSPFRIGSHHTNDLVLADDTVSKHHVELTATPDGYRIVDLGSSNGTFIGAARIGEVTVTAAVTVQLGSSTIRLVPSAHEVEIPASSGARFGGLLGHSLAMRELFQQLEAVAASDSAVLLEGESGVGKELAAESLHRASRRAAGPFVVVDCAALSGSLVESELFGHVRGAFTGATGHRTGLLSSAHGGTVFFDEVSALPAAIQAKLLGVLDRRRIIPVGASQPLPLDVRVIAATRHDLARLGNERRFRADLFIHLAVVRLRLPPLRERMDDLPLLIDSFLADLRARDGAAVPTSLSPMAMATLAEQPWPGNVRELRNAVERLALRLPSEADAAQTDAPEPYTLALEQFLGEFERNYIVDALGRCGQNVSETARQIGVDRRYLQRLMRRHGIDVGREP